MEMVYDFFFLALDIFQTVIARHRYIFKVDLRQLEQFLMGGTAGIVIWK